MSDVTITEFLMARWDDLESEARTNDDPRLWPEGWHPDHVEYTLADIEAKRRIVERCVQDLGAGGGYDGEAELARDVLRSLAMPYAGHPDYAEAWRI